MYNAFFEYLNRFITAPLSDRDKALIQDTFTPHRLRKKQFMLQAGEHARYFAFIVKGAMRMFSVDDQGNEHIVRLGIENWWMGDRESFVLATASPYHIEAIEHSQLLYVSKEGTERLAKELPAFSAMKEQLDERSQMASNRRLTSAISATAFQRYADFISCYPELAERFPQHSIASYLGINKDTLSRIKRQHFSK